MKIYAKAKIAATCTTLLLQFVAHADTQVRAIADWTLWESDSGICYMQTENARYGGGGDGDNSVAATAYFAISKYKNRPDMPIEIMVKLASNSSRSKGVTASISGANTLALPDLDASQKTFWAVPKNLSNFLSKLNNRNTLVVKGVGGRREEARLSANGFSDILREMESRCNSGASLINADFENNFFAGVSDSLDPLQVDVTKAQQLRSIYYAAYKAAFNISNASNDLAKLLAKYQPLIDELAQNKNQTKQIQDVELPANRQVVANAQKQQVDARSEISRVDTATPALNSKIQASQKIADAARAVLAPHEPEYNRITNSLSAAQSTLRESQNRLSYVDTRLRDGANQITQLESEVNNLERNLPQKQNDLNRARSFFRDAQSRRSNFNPSYERDSRLRSNFEYSRLISDRQSMQNTLRNSESDLQRIRYERDRVASDLQRCRIGFIAEVAHEPRPLIPVPSTGGGLIPGLPDPGAGGGLVPGNPNPPAEPPPQRDCSQLEQALNNADNMVNQRETELRQISNRINEMDYRVSHIEQQIDSDVRREYDSLINNEDQARREYDSINNDVTDDQNRISQVRGSDIPRLEREQTQLQSERPSVVNRINESTSAVAKLSAELAQFKSVTGWDGKYSDVQNKNAQLSQDQNNLKQALASKAKAEQSLQAGATTEARAKTQIDELNAKLAVLNNRASELNAGLAKLPAERAQFDATLAAQRVELTSRTSQFSDLLK